MPEFEVYYTTVEIDEDDIIDYVKRNYNPEDIFDTNELDTWALNNNYVKNEEE